MAYGFDESPRIPVEVKAGGVVFFNGYLLHQSLKNRRRPAIGGCWSTNYLSCKSLLPWTDVWEGGSVARADIRQVFPMAVSPPVLGRALNSQRAPPTPVFTFVKPPVPEQQPEALSADRPQAAQLPTGPRDPGVG